MAANWVTKDDDGQINVWLNTPRKQLSKHLGEWDRAFDASCHPEMSTDDEVGANVS